ncbi:hypothetical protein WDD9_004571 [Paenibacillus melissococcoides]|nr:MULTISPECIES: hypothetical protein [Paenibacillus]MEB9898167.1 hypothetical protein [Bacillus cereus]CAH8715496.1 hypothetical protein HTL2_004304 [Paenibacillus melissococcoides]CAH8716455.1 hypothetical protein WDD9_004571 [Paenibacillus melissococcoides]
MMSSDVYGWACSLVAYYGEGYMMKGNVLERCKRSAEVLQCVQGYENLDWFQVVDEAGDGAKNLHVYNHGAGLEM